MIQSKDPRIISSTVLYCLVFSFQRSKALQEPLVIECQKIQYKYKGTKIKEYNRKHKNTWENEDYRWRTMW